MGKAITGVMGGLLVFILVQQAIATMITGTDAGSNILTALLSLVIAFGVIFAAFKLFLSD